MIGQDWRPKTFREMFIQWQAYQIDRWHHTAHIKRMAIEKKNVPYHTVHPFIKKTTTEAPKQRLEATPIFSL